MFDKPNVMLPLAASLNERGVAGFTNSITNGLDQRKINSVYEPVNNSVSGKTTLYLAKRPGWEDSGGTWGTSGQVAYLVSLAPGLFSAADASQWVFSTSGNDIRASNSSGTTTVITTASGVHPAYVDKTSISGTDTLVLQLRNGSTGAQTFWYSTAIATFTQISDADFTGLTHVGKAEFMDGYMFVLDSANQRIYNSDLNSLANWTANNYITKQITQDGSRGLMRFGNQIIAFGNETAEIFTNSGNATGSPLITNPSLFAKVGLPTQIVAGYTHYYCRIEGMAYFVGRTSMGSRSLSLFAYNGGRFERIKNVHLDKILSEETGAIYSVNAITFNGKKAVAIALDPTTATTQRWLMYFPDWNDVFEWNSTVFTPVNNGLYHLGVGTNQHKMYFPTISNTYRDAGTDYTMTHQFQLPSDGNDRKFMPYMALKGDTARSAQNISVEFSDDDYQTFSTARTIDMTSKQKMLTRCGSWQGQRVVRLSHSGNTEVRLSQFLARIE